jgi:hypothetical protein
MKADGAARETQRKYWRDLRNTHRSRLVLQDSPRERSKLSGRKRWTTKWAAGELAIVRRLILRTRDAEAEMKLAREG